MLLRGVIVAACAVGAMLGNPVIRAVLRRAGGPAADAVLHVAEAEQYDLIIIGSRGRSDWQGALMGSTSHRVLHHAHVPVLIVR